MGFSGPGEERLGADDLSEQGLCPVGPKWVYIFDCQEAKKFISAKARRKNT